MIYSEIAPDQTSHASPPSPTHMFNPHRYTPPTSPVYSTDSQATLYSLTSISINLKLQSSSLFISLPILPGGILLVTTDPQQHQPSDWIPILLILNFFKLHPCSTTADHIPETENLIVIQWFLNEPMPTSQQHKLVHCHLWS